MTEFESQLEQIIRAEELLFEPTPGFGHYKPFLAHAVAHPAKMNTELLEFLIREFTGEGETVLDPMCGSGSTGIVAALLNRSAVQVDIEQKFIEWAEQAKQKLDSYHALTASNSIRNVCGDARKLSGLLLEADAVLTSPPYSESISKRGGGPTKLRRDFHRGVSIDTARSYDAVLTSPPYSNSQTEASGEKGQRGGDAKQRVKKDYAKVSNSNIGNLKHGKVDAVITSPPYARDIGGEKGMLVHDEKRKKGRSLYKTYGENPENIDNFPYPNKVDAVITSPPYANKRVISYDNVQWTKYFQQQLKEHGFIEWQGKRYTEKEWRALNHGRIDGRTAKGMRGKTGYSRVDAILTSPPYAGTLEDRKGSQRGFDEGKGITHDGKKTGQGAPTPYSIDAENIGNLRFDVEITSPPYEQTEAFQDIKFMKAIAEDQAEKLKTGRVKGHFRTAEAERRWMEKRQTGSVESEANISNFKKETYLEAMLQVYREMFKVLKPNGLCIIVIKPFVRKRQVVDLPYHTWLLLQKVGFSLIKLYKLRLQQQSFWRILYSDKNPQTEAIAHEYVLVVQKPLLLSTLR